MDSKLAINETTKLFADMMSEGLIVINEEGIIEIYNKKAMEIFRINLDIKNSHESGKINKDDIVIICNNSLGEDDGDLDLTTLKYISLDNCGLEKKDAFISISKYDNKHFKASIKKVKEDEKQDCLVLNSKKIEGLSIESKINFVDKFVNIRINNINYHMDYINSIGHIVIIDSKTKEVKFFQYYGYTARGECIKEILEGKEYRSKGKESKEFEVLGKHIKDIHQSNYIIKDTLNIAKGLSDEKYDKFELINGIPTLCSILKVKIGGKVKGAALKVEDKTDIEIITKERDSAIRRLDLVGKELKKEEYVNKAFSSFVGDSSEIMHVKKLALKASLSSSNILILGKSGTGKSVLARLIHNNSNLKENNFVEINCAAIPSELLESELFGYVSGAFTGAQQKGKKGLLEVANNGSVFLDEIGDMPMSSQAKLLRVIQEGVFFPVGGIEPKTVNTRIIAATNKNLEKEILEGRFREDLFYRINVFPIYIPALKERKEDIYDLIKFVLKKFAKRSGLEKIDISSEATNKLIKYDWPGNVRELENILERAINLSEGSLILSKHIIINDIVEDASFKTFSQHIKEEERKHIKNTLNVCFGDTQKAIQILDMSKSNFYKKLNEYNIEYKKKYI